MEKIAISIILPVYNGEEFIKKAYDFILEQNIENIEIIYVDNNSKDDSISEIKKLQARDKRVVLLQETVQGAAAARNKGITYSKGEYLYMFDIDDQIYPNALKSLSQVLDTYPEVEAVFGKEVKSNQDISETEKPGEETNQIILKPKPYWGIKWFTDLSTVLGPPAFLYRKEVFGKIGLYETDVPASEDTALDVKLGMLCNLAFIDRYVFLYYKHGSSTTDIIKKKTDRSFMQWPRYIKSHLPFYKSNPVPREFKSHLFKIIFSSLGRMINLTEDRKSRVELKNKLFSDIDSIKIPRVIRLYLEILVNFNNANIYKFYVYFLIPRLLPTIIKMNDRKLEVRKL